MIGKYLSVFLVSMVPLVELRLAVPIAIGMGLDYFPSLIVCVLGNMLPVPLIYFFARKEEDETVVEPDDGSDEDKKENTDSEPATQEEVKEETPVAEEVTEETK